MTKFDDNTPMPWGKHKGVPLADVPDYYLLWIWNNPEIDRTRNEALFAYIKDNLDAIRFNTRKGNQFSK